MDIDDVFDDMFLSNGMGERQKISCGEIFAQKVINVADLCEREKDSNVLALYIDK